MGGLVFILVVWERLAPAVSSRATWRRALKNLGLAAINVAVGQLLVLALVQASLRWGGSILPAFPRTARLVLDRRLVDDREAQLSHGPHR